MGLKEQVLSVLVISSTENFNNAISAMLPDAEYKPVEYAASISAAQRKLAQRSYDFIIINSPLKDDLGLHFAIDSSASGSAVVLLLIQNEIFGEVYERVSRHGVFTLPKPLSHQTMKLAFSWMKTASARIKRYEKKTTSIEDKMQEIRLVNKAKRLLISKENMSEPEAHRYLESEAMNRCISKKELAEETINKYS